MHTIGSYEAKTKLPELLREVEKGQSFVITNRGKQIALLCPIPRDASNDLAHAISAMQAFVLARPVAEEKILRQTETGGQ